MSSPSLAVKTGLAVLAGLLLAPGPAAAQDQHYVWIFSSQTTPKLARYTHTWGIFARVSEDCDETGQRPVEWFIISWLPNTLNIRPWALRPEPGTNWDPATTFNWVQGTGQRISLWGPYAVPPEFYASAAQRKNHLESGQVQYKAIDRRFKNSGVANCIHALSDADYTHSRLYYIEVPFYGEAGGRRVVRGLDRGDLLVPVAEDLGWLEDALGFNRFPIIRRDRPGP